METWEDKRRRWGHTPMSQVTAPGTVTPDEKITWLLTDPPQPVVGRAEYAPNYGAKPQDAGPDGCVSVDLPSRYPAPAEAELVTLWKRNGRVVMSVTADGKTNDFYMPPARLVYLLREVAEQLAENTLIQ